LSQNGRVVYLGVPRKDHVSWGMFRKLTILVKNTRNSRIKEHTSDLYDGKNPTLEDLGVKLARIEDRADYELKPFRRNKYYEERVGEFSDPSPPKALA